MNVKWLSASAWLDSDGRHVWLFHRCVDQEPQETMLPFPTWRVENRHVIPSVFCEACGMHATLEIT